MGNQAKSDIDLVGILPGGAENTMKTSGKKRQPPTTSRLSVGKVVQSETKWIMQCESADGGWYDHRLYDNLAYARIQFKQTSHYGSSNYRLVVRIIQDKILVLS